MSIEKSKLEPVDKPKSEVKRVHVHATVFLPGFGQLKSTIDHKSHSGIKLYESNNGILLKLNNIEAIIPYSNIIVYEI